jgi:hypothetical protein
MIMKAHEKIADVAATVIPWLGWLMAGFASGGLMILLARSFFLARSLVGLGGPTGTNV